MNHLAIVKTFDQYIICHCTQESDLDGQPKWFTENGRWSKSRCNARRGS